MLGDTFWYKKCITKMCNKNFFKNLNFAKWPCNWRVYETKIIKGHLEKFIFFKKFLLNILVIHFLYQNLFKFLFLDFKNLILLNWDWYADIKLHYAEKLDKNKKEWVHLGAYNCTRTKKRVLNTRTHHNTRNTRNWRVCYTSNTRILRVLFF